MSLNQICSSAEGSSSFITQGDTYELFCWENNRWNSKGAQVGANQGIQYERVPEGALYLLRNLSAKKLDERIFTYENGKQRWW
jgi:hypothetical protein